MKNAKERDQFKQFADLQARSMEQLLPFASLAADATSELLSKNHEVMGDWVEFTAAQSQLPLEGDASEVAAAQIAAAKKLSETMSARASEYAELAKNWGEQARAATEQATATATVAPVKADSVKTTKAKSNS